jgi:hypothetical protein
MKFIKALFGVVPDIQIQIKDKVYVGESDENSILIGERDSFELSTLNYLVVPQFDYVTEVKRVPELSKLCKAELIEIVDQYLYEYIGELQDGAITVDKTIEGEYYNLNINFDVITNNEGVYERAVEIKYTEIAVLDIDGEELFSFKHKKSVEI